MYPMIQDNQIKQDLFKKNGQKGVLETSTMIAERMEFIEVLSQEFISVTGHGVYAYLSICDVIHLFEQFFQKGISSQEFAKKYVRSLGMI